MIPVLDCPRCGWTTLGGGGCQYCGGASLGPSIRTGLLARGTIEGAKERAVCDRCGVVRPRARRGRPCDECDGTGARVAADDGAVLVATSARCRRCDRLVARAFEGAEIVECACGAEIAIDAALVDEVRAFAEEVADLAGPSPEGRSGLVAVRIARENPHRDVGVRTTFASRTIEREHLRVRVRVSPGSSTRGGEGAPYRAAADEWTRRWTRFTGVSSARLRLEASAHAEARSKEVAALERSKGRKLLLERLAVIAVVGALIAVHVALIALGVRQLFRHRWTGLGPLAAGLFVPTVIGLTYLRALLRRAIERMRP